MAHQEYWSVRAATAAISGMALVFATCWCYFDGVEATAHRIIHSWRDAVRFQIWSYAHLPLYLGIAVGGVGIEHVVTTATEAPLPLAEATILTGAAIAVAVSMAAIGKSKTSPVIRDHHTTLTEPTTL
jgi:low temperature requirement protein LtrA